jgi:hypothetical protein
MNFRKHLPIAIVAGGLGYLCWPYFTDPTATATPKEVAKPAETLVALLSPPGLPELPRDPFAAPATTPKPGTSYKTGGGLVKTPTSRANELGDMVLNGTYVAGVSRMAVINGSLYMEGEKVKAPKNPKANCTLQRVEIDKVVLNVDDKVAELRYLDDLSNSTAKAALVLSAAQGTPSTASAGRSDQAPGIGTSNGKEPPTDTGHSDRTEADVTGTARGKAN